MTTEESMHSPGMGLVKCSSQTSFSLRKIDYFKSILSSFLQEEVSGAKKRIVISSLYLGTGQFEKDLVSFLMVALDGLAGRGACI